MPIYPKSIERNAPKIPNKIPQKYRTIYPKAVAALQLTPQALYTQLKTFGFLFEQMCIRDLIAYTRPDGVKVIPLATLRQ